MFLHNQFNDIIIDSPHFDPGTLTMRRLGNIVAGA